MSKTAIATVSNSDLIGSFMNADWAMTEAGLAEVQGNFRNLPMLVGPNPDPKTLEAYQSERLDSTFSVKVRDGVAIIPITGPIFDSYNWYVYYFGGTALSFLARDLQACIDDREVHAVLFVLHTPGGTVTGVNEMGKMIRAARGRIPMTAYVKGYMCSAGLWLGVQAGEVVVDETAIVGSLGVCTTYLDDRKWMEKIGFEEIEFISSKSPYKNAPPYEDEGRKRIQARVNAICEVFGSEVALGRDVPVETVWRDFGQGDVFVGQQSVDAGIADRTGDFEETLALLSKTHAPHLYSGDRAAGLLPTISFSADIQSKTAEETAAEEIGITDDSAPVQSSENANTENQEEKIMSAENKKEPVAGTETAEVTTNASEPAGAAQKASQQELTAQVEQLTEQLRISNERAENEAKARQTAEAAAEKTALTARMEKAAETFGGDKAKKTGFLVKLAEKFGEDSAEVEEYIEDQKALVAQVDSGELFKEQGSSNAGEKMTAEERLDKLAVERAAADKCSYEQAYTKVLDENKALYAEYQKESGE